MLRGAFFLAYLMLIGTRRDEDIMTALLNPWLLIPLIGAAACQLAIDNVKRRALDSDDPGANLATLTTETPTRS